ncbi:ZYRO0B08294p [Zygosaccharomyces rouxii]|uniref:ZYRO0B08294p n=1 Tax=Zygosaccharomyces rouxii (strain ATCC 2623 / CBS 732 / NBRC 1130 / NCYC 568 / NRRL Y-229) TaxID=559307 RepID=C5DRG6_ZYGRC|nr:uncharacterized protein ZYRO0B08294g [Zygosaccharomyces rouxii]CAR26377.1 ZYRO0B08294p [Zygosaccharomyces rouxii]
MKLNPDISSELRQASRMPTMRYWFVGLFGAVVPAIYLRSYMLRGTTAAGQQISSGPPRRSLWQKLSDSYDKIPEDEATTVIFSSIM